jgi:hypothetical protein
MRSGSTPTTATDPALNGPSSGQVMALWGDYKRRKASTPKERSDMALTRDFKETVAARVQNDPAFAQALLDEAIKRALKVEVRAQVVMA